MCVVEPVLTFESVWCWRVLSAPDVTGGVCTVSRARANTCYKYKVNSFLHWEHFQRRAAKMTVDTKFASWHQRGFTFAAAEDAELSRVCRRVGGLGRRLGGLQDGERRWAAL